jgi:hypothetical protein
LADFFRDPPVVVTLERQFRSPELLSRLICSPLAPLAQAEQYSDGFKTGAGSFRCPADQSSLQRLTEEGYKLIRHHLELGAVSENQSCFIRAT